MLRTLNTWFIPEGVSSVNGLPTMVDSTLARMVPQVSSLIETFFSPLNILASHPTISINNDTTVIHVFYYAYNNNSYINVNTINSLGEVLSNMLNSNVELRFVKLYYPYLDAYILAQYISKELMLVKWDEIKRRIISSILPIRSIHGENVVGNTYITGVKITLAGRLINEPTLPRQSTKTFSIGSFKNHSESILTQGKYTAVNIKGAYTVNIIISQRLSSL